MLAWLVLAHFVTIVVLIAVPALRGRLGLWAAAVPSLATLVWAIGEVGEPGEAHEWTWVGGLDLTLGFESGGLNSLMLVIVSAVGVLVAVYATGYFAADDPGLRRFTPTLLAFTTSMVGLVTATSIWTLFLFWELTSVTSFLLVGHKFADPVARAAARRALVLTVAGGLVLMGGLVALADATGTTRISDMGEASGAAAGVAAIAVLVAAATKSAQVPFHSWLPGAMAAPTPVSAYLHSATMVKAGVVLVALMSPVLAGSTGWRPLGLAFGLASMLWGGIGALRHHDAKLVLAWGTISQLGFMVALLALGTGKAVFAAVAILFAHAAFKSALFMVVGEIDVRTGTRDLRELDGLARRMPVAFAIAVVAGASMAGVPPLIGFPAKEAAVEAVIGLEGTERWLLGGLLIAGMVLTVAYTVRLLVGLFGPGTGHGATGPSRLAMTAPAAIAAGAGVVAYAASGTVDRWVVPAATSIDPAAGAYTIVRWPGATTALWISVAMVVVGTGLGLLVPAGRHAPRTVSAGLVDGAIDAVPSLSRRLVARIQHGSLPVYLATMGVVIAAASLPFLGSLDAVDLRVADTAIQGVLAGLVVVAAVGAAFVTSRLGAALAIGIVGVGVAGLFVAHGAPDLALTQLLVESVIVVGFVLGLGPLSARFPSASAAWKGTRIVVSVAVGAAAALALAVAAGSDGGRAPVEKIAANAVDEGGGNNVVNVILTDLRALDTLGEIVVLVVVAIGVLSLGRVRAREVAR